MTTTQLCSAHRAPQGDKAGVLGAREGCGAAEMGECPRGQPREDSAEDVGLMWEAVGSSPREGLELRGSQGAAGNCKQRAPWSRGKGGGRGEP